MNQLVESVIWAVPMLNVLQMRVEFEKGVRITRIQY
jgi:hypothetical protein